MKALIAALLLFALPAMAEFQVPLTPNPVNDYANVLTPGGKEKIAEALVGLKTDVGAQVGVLIVDSLDGSTIESASLAVATNWKLGSEDKDDGVLVFIAVKDRKMRVEVGSGLEGIITDYYSKQITTGMKPFLKAGDYDGAVLSATTGILNRITEYRTEITSKSGNTDTTDTTATTTTTGTETDTGSGLGLLLALLAFIGVGGVIVYVNKQNQKARDEAAREARRIAKLPPTPEQSKMAKLMYADVQKHAKKNPAFPKEEKDEDDGPGFGTGLVVGALLGSSSKSSSSDDEESSSSGGGFGSFGGGSDSGGGSFGGSDFGGGGGGFSGGGSSDSF
jgi:uncharacterized protein